MPYGDTGIIQSCETTSTLIDMGYKQYLQNKYNIIIIILYEDLIIILNDIYI